MQPVVETVSDLERKVDLVVPTANIENEINVQLKRVARTTKIQGFRPGKAPLSMVERTHGANIRYEVINQEVGRQLDEIFAKGEYRVAGAPALEAKEDETNEDQLVFTATFEVYPEIELPDLSKLEVTRSSVTVGDEQIQQTIDVLRKQRADYTEQSDRAAQDGDRITLDFTGSIDGEVFEGGSAENFEFILGEGRMLPEFETAIQGMKAGEEKTFPLEFPEDYAGAEVAGKTAEFAIKVSKVSVAVLPELDAEFAKMLGQDDGDIDKLLNEVKENIEREVKARTLMRTKASVLDALVESVSFDVPKALIQGDAQDRIAQARNELAQRGVPNADTMEIPVEGFEKEAERRVRLGLLLAELVKDADLDAKEEQLKAKIEEFAKNYEDPESVVQYYLSDPQRRSEIQAIVLEDNVVDHVIGLAQITDTEVDFNEIMGTN